MAPPLVLRPLRPAVRRFLPILLATERRPVENAPDGADGLDPPPLGEVGAVNAALIVTDEDVEAEHLTVLMLVGLRLGRREAEVDPEVTLAVRVPGNLVPAHPALERL